LTTPAIEARSLTKVFEKPRKPEKGVVETVILTPLGLIIYSRLEKEARRTGALGTY